MDKSRLAGKHALITGGAQGMGAAIGEYYAAQGAKVCLGDVNLAGCEEVAARINSAGGEAIAVKLDVTQRDQISAAVQATVDAFGSINVMLNNAGINKIDKLRDISIEDFDNVQKVNLRAPFTLIKTLSTSMAHKKWGRIVNISSIFGLVTKEKRTSYSVSKNAINGLTKSAALDLAGEGILVNSVSPGFIDTELTRNVLGEEGIREMVKLVPLGRLGSPESISSAVLFLCSEENQFLTGQNIVVDGGFTCG